MRYRPGPGWVVAAAFIGPGTVTTATVAGASLGAALLWAVVLSVAITIVLQEAVARLATAGGLTLGQALRRLAHGRARVALTVLVLAAVVLGAAAFEIGNLTGAALAIGLVRDSWIGFGVLATADLAFLLLWFGHTRVLERVLTALVGVMALAFLANLALLPVDWGAVLRGLAPRASRETALLAVAIVGTTVVPYNLFLHGSLARARGWSRANLQEARLDLVLAIAAGGALTGAILVTAATVLSGVDVRSASDMAPALEPLLGRGAVLLFATGLLAAAFTSAVTAPLAAAYAAAHVLGWDDATRGRALRAVWGGVLLVATLVALSGLDPVALIVAAQAANGLLLPIVAAALVLVTRRSDVMGPHRNGPLATIAQAAAVAIVTLLGLALIYTGLLRL